MCSPSPKPPSNRVKTMLHLKTKLVEYFMTERKMRAVLIILTAAVLMAGCRKSETEGQVFVTSSAGINFPMGGVEIRVIKESDYQDFVKAKQQEIFAHEKLLEQRQKSALKNLEDATKAEKAAESTLASFAGSKAYTNDPAYIASVSVYNRNVQASENSKVPMAYSEARSGGRYGNPITSISGRQTAEAQNRYIDSKDNVRRAGIAVRGTIAEIQIKTEKPLKEAVFQASIAVSKAKNEVDVAKDSLSKYPSITDYWEGFIPKPVESTVTDSSGNFRLKKKVRV